MLQFIETPGEGEADHDDLGDDNGGGGVIDA